MSFWEWLRGENTATEKEGFMEFSQRYASDPVFRDQLRRHFRSAIKEYELTSEEKEVARRYAEGRVDPRIHGYANRVLNDLLNKQGH